jgi:hypothetical protein
MQHCALRAGQALQSSCPADPTADPTAGVVIEGPFAGAPGPRLLTVWQEGRC